MCHFGQQQQKKGLGDDSRSQNALDLKSNKYIQCLCMNPHQFVASTGSTAIGNQSQAFQ